MSAVMMVVRWADLKEHQMVGNLVAALALQWAALMAVQTAELSAFLSAERMVSLRAVWKGHKKAVGWAL